MGSSDGEYITTNVKIEIQGKLDLADTDLTENLDLKDTPQKIWATIFDFYYVSLLEIAENLVPF